MALCELLRLCDWHAFQAALLEALRLLPGRAQAHRLRWLLAEVGTSLRLVPARFGAIEVCVEERFVALCRHLAR